VYISDYELECIHRIYVANCSITQWQVNDIPWGLSVTRSHHLLVTLPLKKSIQEYNSHGNLKREIPLNDSIDNPQHSIELSSGLFVVCYRGATLHGVCIVDTSGCIIQSYGGPPGSSAGQLDEPYYLAVDEQTNVFVADWGNDKVQILSPDLLYLGDVALPELKYGPLFRPCRIHLDELSKRLYIGEGWHGCLIVLSACD
jgi:hypothetical protein